MESFGTKQETQKWEYTYKVQETHLPYVFRISEDEIYSSIHFDGKTFMHPQNKEKKIDLNNFINDLKTEFKVSKVFLSCCYPQKARELVGDIEGVEVIGKGDAEVRTIFNNIKNEIKVESC